MKNNVKELRQKLEQNLAFNYALKTSELQKLCNTIYDNHNIPIGRTSDIITGRVSIEEADDFELFCLLYYTNEKEINKYFTDQEIKQYSNGRRPDKNVIKYPIRIKCIQTASDSFIGKTDVDFLMLLRNNQLINYNKNTQRNMDMVVRGTHKYYKISLNKAAVKNIKEAFETGKFIPNTITLNLPLDRDNEFYYDEKNSELVIEKLECFDITDGYHRYVAMGQVRDENPEWNYPMELRITNFSEDKMKTFIYQEDQKTQMRRVDSESLNMNNQANIVVERLNQDPMFFLTGNILRNGGLVSFSEMADIINFLYYKGKRENTSPKFAFHIQKTIRDGWTAITVADMSYVEHEYTFDELCIILYGIKESEPTDNILKVLADKYKLNKIKFSNKVARQTLFTEIEKLYREG